VGNEELDLEMDRVPTEGKWQNRVVRNKFPALVDDGQPIHTVDGVQHSMTAVGYHEVLVDHPNHNTSFAVMQPAEILTVVETLQRRGRWMSQDSRIQQVIPFKNHGRLAGASLLHPHCQIIGMPVVPNTIRRRIMDIRRHHESTGEYVLCRMLQDELIRGERLVMVSEHFVCFVLYAALSPFHMWIVPRVHRPSFLDVPQIELADLAQVLHVVLRKVYVGLNNPDYNLIFRSSPVKEVCPDFHWYISLVLRLSFMAGFEMGSGMHINPSLPESSAAFLREVKI
jgi:UDPglucose--hexose-1-phosphate uridylyltransferase